MASISFRSEPASVHVSSAEESSSLHMTIPLSRPHETALCETWWSDKPVTTGAHGPVHYAHDGEVIVCATTLGHHSVFADVVADAYRHTFEVLTELGFTKIFRVWNYIENINAANSDGLEIYRDFCLGRANAFSEFEAFAHSMPAATGIGSTGSGICYYLLATRDLAVEHVENSLQIPAYEYPKRYGPKSPSFARATRVTESVESAATNATSLYISGTASIRGHLTIHEGDLAQQFDVTIENMNHLVDKTYGGERSLKDASNVKVYYRHATDLSFLQQHCAEVFGSRAPIAFFNVDICRSDLLVEIEAIIN